MAGLLFQRILRAQVLGKVRSLFALTPAELRKPSHSVQGCQEGFYGRSKYFIICNELILNF